MGVSIQAEKRGRMKWLNRNIGKSRFYNLSFLLSIFESARSSGEIWLEFALNGSSGGMSERRFWRSSNAFDWGRIMRIPRNEAIKAGGFSKSSNLSHVNPGDSRSWISRSISPKCALFRFISASVSTVEYASSYLRPRSARQRDETGQLIHAFQTMLKLSITSEGRSRNFRRKSWSSGAVPRRRFKSWIVAIFAAENILNKYF